MVIGKRRSATFAISPVADSIVPKCCEKRIAVVCDVLIRKTRTPNWSMASSNWRAVCASTPAMFTPSTRGEVWARFVNSFNVKGHAFHASLSVGSANVTGSAERIRLVSP